MQLMAPTKTTHEIISRAQAKALGLKTYFTGNPCKRGHVALRQVSSEMCMVCSNDKAKGYYRKNKASAIARRMQRYHDDPQGERAKMREHYNRNKDDAKAKRKHRYALNGDLLRAQSRDWAKSNPAMRKAQHIKRRARKLNATPKWFGEFDELVMLEAADLCRRREASTGNPWHVDHMIPLQAREACGLHVGANIQVIPAAMNIKKRNSMSLIAPGEWLRYA